MDDTQLLRLMDERQLQGNIGTIASVPVKRYRNVVTVGLIVGGADAGLAQVQLE